MAATFVLQIEEIDTQHLTLTLKVWALASGSILDMAFTRGFVISSLTQNPWGATQEEYEARKSIIASWANKQYKNELANVAFPPFLYENDASKNAEKEAFLNQFCSKVEVLRIENFAEESHAASMWKISEHLFDAGSSIFEAYQHYFLKVYMTDIKWLTAYKVGDVVESSSFEVFLEDSKNTLKGKNRLKKIPTTLFTQTRIYTAVRYQNLRHLL